MTEEELIQTDHFETMEELINTIKFWKIDNDYAAYCRFFDIRCAFELVNKIEKQQKEIENSISKNKIRDKIKELEKELKSIQDKLSKNMLFSESEFYSFSEYTKWRIEINQKIKDIDAKIAVLKELLEE